MRGWVLLAFLGSVALAGPQKPSPKALEAKRNSELFSEMFRVVFDRKIEDRAFFGNWVDTLNQGASLDGMYNTLTHSEWYRLLETQFAKGNSNAAKFFSEEMELLQKDLPYFTMMDKSQTGPLPVMGMESLLQVDRNPVQPQKRLPAAEMEKLFQKSSIYVLKRLLGDEALKWIEFRSNDRGKLAEWYGPWTSRMAKLGIYFGLEQRNWDRVDFHTKWAMTADPVLLKWEVLNRYHRVLNAFLNSKE